MERMNKNCFATAAMKYKPEERRNRGRPRKRWIGRLITYNHDGYNDDDDVFKQVEIFSVNRAYFFIDIL